jgi:4-diphosphocytidyl-2-C-methyl-D-erythritol kinase
MIVLPHAKINLGLHVVRLRTDGYRDIRTVMIPVPLHDIMEAVVDPALANGEVVMTHSGLPVPGDPAQDLCLRAVRSFAENRILPGLRIHLHKVIPTGAGLGGGSSDAAHMLLLLNDLLQLGLGYEKLHAMAAGLGSDCAFFLRNMPQLAEGRGEVLSPITVRLSGWWLVLANPGTHVGTAEVYANTPIEDSSVELRSLMGKGPAQWKGILTNAMEHYVFDAYPEVGRLKEQLIEAGATYAAMSGSGASVFGFFKERPVLKHLAPSMILLTKL